MNWIIKKHKQTHIKSYYRIDHHALQVFEMIKDQLWAPGFRQQALGLVGEISRDVFW
jgi:hypothetical protein